MMGKMRYYPTPLSVVKRVKSFHKFQEEKITVLDPCCGEGLAIKEFVEGVNAKTYRIKLYIFRYDENEYTLGNNMVFQFKYFSFLYVV